MKRRTGFTLIEVMLGIVITGVVALLAYGAVATAADTRERLASDRFDRMADGAWRSLVTGAVRNVRAPLEYDAPTLIVQDGVGPEGRPADRLGLVTASGAPPLSPGADWRLVIAVEDGALVARASPLGPWQDTRVIRAPDRLTSMSVEVLGPGGWAGSWASDVGLPNALRLTLWTADGPDGAPLVIALPLGAP